MRRIAVLFTVITISTLCVAAPLDLLVNSSHQGAVSALQLNNEGDTLVSGGEDGTVRFWHLPSARLRQILKVSHLPVTVISLHPRLPRIAILENHGQQSYKIAVWDWEAGKKLFTMDVEDRPLFLSFSSRGTYLAYSAAEQQSLRFYDAKTGRRIPLLQGVHGIVSFFTLSSSEKNLMVYQPSGRISYWELSTGKRLESFDTLAGLSQIYIARNKRYIAARWNQRLVMVDLTTGRTMASVVLPDILSISLHGTGNRVSVLSKEEERVVLSQWYFTGGGLFENTSIRQQFSEESLPARVVEVGQEDIFLGNHRGEIWRLSSLERAELLAENHLLEVSDIAVHDNLIAIGSADAVLVFELKVQLLSREPADMIIGFSQETYDNPQKSPIGLDFIDEEKLVLWGRTSARREVHFLKRPQGSFGGPIIEFPSPILQVGVNENGLLAVEKSGSVRIFDRAGENTVFEYSAPGTKMVIPVGRDILVGARTRISAFQGSLLRVDTRTGETVPLAGSSLLSYDLAYDSERKTLYSLSVNRKDTNSTTCVIVRRAPDFDMGQAIIQFAGEDLTASVTVAPDGWLYTSLGYETVTGWKNYIRQTLAPSKHIPRKLKATDQFIISLNKDSTVTVWDRRSGGILLEFYPFKDLSWVALFPNERTYLSHNADRYLNLADLRLTRIPGAPQPGVPQPETRRPGTP
jgi:WD40 repeat protein